MRIFDPKDQLGNSLLSSADTQKSSVKLEKQMAEGSAITLTSTDISDIENWELSTARVKVDGQMISFLPDTSRDGDGNLIVTLGETFSDVVLVLKRTVFDGMKQEEEEEDIIEVKIRQLMAETMAAATAPTPRDEEEVQENVDKWKTLGDEAYEADPVKYANAKRDTLGGYRITGEGIVEVNDYFLSVDSSFVQSEYEYVYVDESVEGVKWNADLPSFKDGSSDNWAIKYSGKDKIIEWNGKLPNLINGWGMFDGCSGLTSWTVALPNSLTNANTMFSSCSGMTSFSTPSGTLPSSITDACGMFSDCSGLTNFTASLAGLTNCENFASMFWGCILNKDSIENILYTLPDRKDKSRLTIHIGGDKTMGDSVKDDLSSLAQSVSTTKNWNIVLDWNPQG